MQTTQSEQLYSQAQRHIPGGVNSPVRSFSSVGGNPIFIQSASGAEITDVDNNHYIDYVLSWGPMITGHAHPKVISAVQQMSKKGLSFGAATEIEIQLADKICELMPNIDMLRMVNSGTEATMSAIRLARGFTGRDKIIKFEGCYHGHSDSLLVKAGSGALTFGTPSSPGVPTDTSKHTLTATFNDLNSVKQCFEAYPDDIATIILEPVAGNMNCVPAEQDFMNGLRQLCDHYHSLLIFDEVMTGFRVGLHGAQHYYKIKPDLTCLGKVIGGGMPVGAFGGRKDIMQQIAPLGPVYQAGTLSGNPVAMAAGLATLDIISQPDIYDNLQKNTTQLTNGLQMLAKHYNIPFTTNQACSMFGFFFTEEQTITHFKQVTACNAKRFTQFFHGMLKNGVYLAPSAYETGFTSIKHDATIVDRTLDIAESVFKTL